MGYYHTISCIKYPRTLTVTAGEMLSINRHLDRKLVARSANNRQRVYAFSSTHPDHTEPLKVGYTERNVEAWVAAQFPGWLFKRADMSRRMDLKGYLV